MRQTIFSTLFQGPTASGNGNGNGIYLGNWNAETNTPELPAVPTSPAYAVGEFYVNTGPEAEFQGITYPTGSRIIVDPDGADLIWALGDPLPVSLPGGAINTLQFNLDDVNFGGLLNSLVNPTTGAVTLASLILGASGLDLTSSAPIDFFNSNNSGRFSIANTSIINAVSTATFFGANSYNFDTKVQAADLITTNVISASFVGTDLTGKIIEVAGIPGTPGGPDNSVQVNDGSGGFIGYTGLIYDGSDLSLKGDFNIISPDGSKTAIFATADNNRLHLTNVDELDCPAIRSSSYITCTDIYLTNASTFSEIHNYVDADDVLQFVQTIGSAATANFQMSLAATAFVVPNADNTFDFQINNIGPTGNAVANFTGANAYVFDNAVTSFSGSSYASLGSNGVALFDSLNTFLATIASNNSELSFSVQGSTKLSIAESLITINPTTLQFQGDLLDFSKYFQLTADSSDAVMTLQTGASFALNSGTAQIKFLVDDNQINFSDTTGTASIHRDNTTGSLLFDLFDVGSSTFNFLTGNVLVNEDLQVGGSILSNGGVDINASNTIDFLNGDNSARCYIYNSSSTTNSILSFVNAASYRFDAPMRVPQLNSVAGVQMVAIANDGITVGGYVSSKGHVDINNNAYDSYLSLTNTGPSGSSIFSATGATAYNFGAAVKAPDLITTNVISASSLATDSSGKIIAGSFTIADSMGTLIGGTLLNSSYFVIQKAKFAGTITSFVAKTGTIGTAGTYTISINGTPVTGLNAVANTTGSVETNATAANTFAINDVIEITFASTIANSNFEGQLSFTRTL